MATQPKAYITPEEYLARERATQGRNEYFRGEIFAMGGASYSHTLIVTNVVTTLSSQLRKKPCTVHSADLRVKVDVSGLYTYPDVLVACGELQFDDQYKDTLLNPMIIIEVLSESTKDYDRGRKFEHYRKIPSFVEYVLVAQDECHVEHFVKQEEGWLLSETNRMKDTIALSAIKCKLSLKEIYQKITFPEAPAV